MNKITRWLMVLGFFGIAGLMLVQFPDAIGGLKTYKDEISSISKLVTIGVAVVVIIRWLSVGSIDSEKNQEKPKLRDINVKIEAGENIIMGDKKEVHVNNSSDTKINH